VVGDREKRHCEVALTLGPPPRLQYQIFQPGKIYTEAMEMLFGKTDIDADSSSDEGSTPFPLAMAMGCKADCPYTHLEIRLAIY
jgi:hypothetical protein